jgi:DNA-directed RNA polymerase subunit beta'
MSDTRENSQGPSVNSVSAVRISVASPEQIRSWSCGEVTEAKGLDRATLKPYVGGIFCERIFGPVKDFTCSCGKYSGKDAKEKYKGVICDKCGVKVTHSGVRRERMGHIELACPVSHAWFVEGTPSPLALLLGISRAQLRNLVYFKALAVTGTSKEAGRLALKQLRDKEREQVARAGSRSSPERAAEKRDEVRKRFNREADRLAAVLEDPAHSGKLVVFTTKRDRVLAEKYAGSLDVGTGAEALLKVLVRLDLNVLHDLLSGQLNGPHRKQALKRLHVVRALRRSGNRPEWMIFTVLPVLPPGLRPLIRLDDGSFVTSDLNEHYLGIIRRNNRLKRLLEQEARESDVLKGKRMLQEAVDGLIGRT